MAAYLLKRILLIIPTLFGIMLISFAIIQFAPGGPVERVIAQITGTDVSATARIGGGQGDGMSSAAVAVDAERRRHQLQVSRRPGARPGVHQAAREAVRLRQAGARALLPDAQELRAVRFRQELLPRRQRAAADQGEAAGLGLARHLDDADHLPDLHSARHPQGRARRREVRHLDVGRAGDRLRYPRLPGGGVPAGGVRRRLVLPVVPLARPHFGILRPALAHRQDRQLFLAPDAAADRHVARRLHDHDVPDAQLVPRRDPQAVRDDGARPRGSARARCSTATSSATPCC